MTPSPQTSVLSEPEVLETGERMTFRVLSHNPKTPNKRYRVDLLANEGRGWCACPDFGVRRQHQLDAGLPAFKRATACRHVIAACLHVCRETFPEMARSEQTPPL